MAAWTTAAWQAQLQALHLTGCSISASAFCLIGGGYWALLQELDLECTDVDAEVMYDLTAAEMPVLRILRLDRSRGMSVAAFAELATGDWPALKCLHLNHTLLPGMDVNDDNIDPFRKTVDCIRQLILGRWPSLERLELSNCCISNEALRYLIVGQWPQLCYLDLCCNGLDWRSYATLKGESKQQIRRRVNILRPTKLLAGGYWPKLRCIDLSP